MPDAAFEITGADQWLALAERLVRVPEEARLGQRAKMRAVGASMRTAVQTNALTIPVHGTASTGLRQALARATKLRTTGTPETVSVRVEVDSSAMPPGMEKLPSLMEGRGWTHPVYGHSVTVFQPGHAYFKPAVDPYLPVMRTAIESGYYEAARKI
jgi:hypothetical protein